MIDDKLKEQVSALADDELGREERQLLLRRMTDDAELRERWSRYCLIRDSLRDGLPASFTPDFASTLSLRLDGEPPVDVSMTGRFGPAMQRMTGLAVAATVAAVALLSLQMDRPVDEQVPEAATVVPVGQSPVVPAVRFATSQGPSWERARPEVQAQLNQLLLTHSDAAEAPPVADPDEDER